jgi:hypothetical protein
MAMPALELERGAQQWTNAPIAGKLRQGPTSWRRSKQTRSGSAPIAGPPTRSSRFIVVQDAQRNDLASHGREIRGMSESIGKYALM